MGGGRRADEVAPSCASGTGSEWQWGPSRVEPAAWARPPRGAAAEMWRGHGHQAPAPARRREAELRAQ
jgi:hypothetical protein